MIATFPHVLGYSIEANLKPTVKWIKGLGLGQSQVAKVILRRPQVLGYSIEANLKPTVEWIKGLGLSQSQVAELIATFPQVLGLSIEANLRVKYVLLQNFFPGSAAAELLARAPRLWSYRQARLEHRLHVLQSQGRLSKLASAMTLGLDAFSCRFPSSPDTATNTGKSGVSTQFRLSHRFWRFNCLRPSVEQHLNFQDRDESSRFRHDLLIRDLTC